MERNKQKVTIVGSLPLFAHFSPLNKNKKGINLVHFRNVEEEFHSRNQMMTSHNARQHFAFSHAHS